MKKIIITGLAIAALGFAACSSDDDGPIEPTASCTDGIQNGDETGVDCGGSCEPCDDDEQDNVLSGIFEEDTTLTNDVIWELDGRVVVEEGITVTIEPGTIIKGQEGQGSEASAFIVAQGGMIDAVGTADEPIIFTSINDNIEVGEKWGTNLDENDQGLWGGVLILGYAPSSFEGDGETANIEGIPADLTYGLYGGDDSEDNSGNFEYVSIRHGGVLIGEANEINGLTMGGVGTGTTIDHVEVVGNVDDGFEWFGGTVNASNLVAFAGGDDGLDIDQAYSGTISNAMVIQGETSDHALEIDGPEGTAEGSFTIENLTLLGYAEAESEGEMASFRDGATGHLENVYATGFNSSQVVDLDGQNSADSYANGDLTFANWEIVLPEGVSSVTELFLDTTDSTNFSEDASDFAEGVEMDEETIGADTSEFEWTYAYERSAF